MAQLDNGNSAKPMSPESLREFANAQAVEIEKYKWCLGIELGHNPLDNRSVNDIALEWITNHSAAFRKYWTESVKLP